MGNKKTKPSNNNIQKDLNKKFQKNNNKIDEIMNIKIDNSQHIQGLNEIYSQAIFDFNQKQIKFKQSIQNGNKVISKRIQKAIDGLFDPDQKDSLPQIFEQYRIPEKVSMADRQKLMIFYHVGVLEKYYQVNTMVDKDPNSDFKIKNNEKQRKKQRKDLREYAIKIIKGNYPFVIKHTLSRFDQVMEEVFYRDLRDKQQCNNEKSMIEFQQKLISSFTIEEANFIYECYQIITIILTKIVEFLFSKTISNNIPNIFQGSSDLYLTIFCGQIVEKLVFNSKNKILFRSSIDALFYKTNEMKYLDIKCFDQELIEVLQQRNASAVQSMNSDSTFEKDLNRYQSVIIQTAMNNNNKRNISLNNQTIQSNTSQIIDQNREQVTPQNQSDIKNINLKSSDINTILDSIIEVECKEDNQGYAESIFFSYSFSDQEHNKSLEVSQSMKVHLKENYKEYLNEIYISVEECLNEKYYFKKIKKVSKLVVKIQERFRQKSQNKNQSIIFVQDKDNWYDIIFMILKSFLSFKPQSHQDFFILTYIINLLQLEEFSSANLFDVQHILESIINIDEQDDNNQNQENN